MSDSEVVDLARLRVDKSGDSRDWTPLDALRDVLDDIESGKINPRIIYIAMECPDADGQHTFFDFQCAGGLKLEYIGLLSRHLHIANNGGDES